MADQDLQIARSDAAVSVEDVTNAGPSHEFDGYPMLIPVPRAAELLGISRSAAYRCVASGDLPTAHLGGRVYVVTSRLQALLESA
jgi:excisionase family DNA binding protein